MKLRTTLVLLIIALAMGAFIFGLDRWSQSTRERRERASTLGTRDPELMAKARGAGRLWDIDTGHDLMITEPQAVAEALLQVASAD